MQTPVKVVLERRPHTALILDGTLPPPRGLPVEFVDVKPVNKHTGAEPVNHTVVIREELLGAYPGIGRDLYEWFAAAKETAGPTADPGSRYGMTEANRTSLDVLLELTRDEFGAEPGLPSTPEQVFLPVLDR